MINSGQPASELNCGRSWRSGVEQSSQIWDQEKQNSSRAVREEEGESMWAAESNSSWPDSTLQELLGHCLLWASNYSSKGKQCGQEGKQLWVRIPAPIFTFLNPFPLSENWKSCPSPRTSMRMKQDSWKHLALGQAMWAPNPHSVCMISLNTLNRPAREWFPSSFYSQRNQTLEVKELAQDPTCHTAHGWPLSVKGFALPARAA